MAYYFCLDFKSSTAALIASSANTEQCILTGGSANSSTIEVFLIVLVPHLIWLNNNEFITITYGLARTGLEQSGLIDHIKFPLIFLIKQIGILIPFLILVWLLVKKIKFKIKKEIYYKV